MTISSWLQTPKLLECMSGKTKTDL